MSCSSSGDWVNVLLLRLGLRCGYEQVRLSENLPTKSSWENCKGCNRPQTFRICSATSGKLEFAGTWPIQTIPTSGQPSFATSRHSNQTAIESTTCSGVSNWAVDFCKPVAAAHRFY